LDGFIRFQEISASGVGSSFNELFPPFLFCLLLQKGGFTMSGRDIFVIVLIGGIFALFLFITISSKRKSGGEEEIEMVESKAETPKKSATVPSSSKPKKKNKKK
jgi:hypothetical protein